MARSKRYIAMTNKRRGKAYQTTLAKIVGGMNIGTLGGEDVMHDRFSFEAKTRQKGNTLEKHMVVAERYFKGEPVVVTWVCLGIGAEISMVRYRHFEKLNSLELKEFILVKKKSSALTMMKQAQRNCPEGKSPIVCLHTLNLRHTSDIVVLDKKLLNVLLAESQGQPLMIRRLGDYLTLKKEQDHAKEIQSR